jgi:hypothetical protein
MRLLPQYFVATLSPVLIDYLSTALLESAAPRLEAKSAIFNLII